MDVTTPQFVRRYTAGEAVAVDVVFDTDVSAYSLRSAVARTLDGTRPGLTPLVVYTGVPGVLWGLDGKTVTLSLTAADSGTALGPGRFAWCLWRTDAGLEKLLAWVELELG